MKSKSVCIYCGSEEQLCRQSHALPRALGAFKNQPSLKNRVCQQCDREIGKCEEQLVKCGPEAILRIVLGIKGRSGDSSTSPFRRAHAGRKALKFKTIYPGTNYEVLVEPIAGTKNIQILPQIVIVFPDGKCSQILMTDPNMTVAELETSIRATGIKGKTNIWPIASTEEEEKRIFNLLHQSKFFMDEIADENIKPCLVNVEAAGDIFVDAGYFRAIAKIAFHYFLIHNSSYDGSESAFEPIRRFIRYGEGTIESFVKQKRRNLIAELDQGYRPKYYGHILMGIVNRQDIKGMIQLFIGHDIDPQYYEVYLGENPRQIFVPDERFGNFYCYFEPEKQGQYSGEIQRLFASNYIQPVHGLVLPGFSRKS